MTITQSPEAPPQPKRYGLAALLALAGLTDSIYLTITHLTGENVTCIASTGCSKVLSSAYASVGQIPLAAFGVLGYFAAFSFAILAAFGYPRARTCLALLVAAMLAATLWLLYVQAFVLNAFCTFCLLSAAITFSLSAIVVTSFFTVRRHRTAGQITSIES